MAFEDYDEFEQGEAVRKWIKENGVAVIAGVVLALVLIFGWRQWQAHRKNHDVQAASQFSVVQDAVQSGNQQAMAAALEDLQKNYSNTPYAVLGSAAVADFDVRKNELKTAATNLQWAVAHSDVPALKSLFTLRLVRVLLAQDQAQEALTALAGIPTGDYAALVAELRGDAQLQLGNLDAAREAYAQALAKLDKDAPQRNSVQMKLDNLSQPAAAPTGTKP